MELAVRSAQLASLQQGYQDLSSELQREKDARHVLSEANRSLKETVRQLVETNLNCSERVEELTNRTSAQCCELSFSSLHPVFRSPIYLFMFSFYSLSCIHSFSSIVDHTVTRGCILS